MGSSFGILGSGGQALHAIYVSYIEESTCLAGWMQLVEPHTGHSIFLFSIIISLRALVFYPALIDALYTLSESSIRFALEKIDADVSDV